ncbi:phage capsid protein [Nitrobacteraceae bacterium UC4446_H13]
MSGPVTDAHKLEYSRNVTLAVQQKKSRFEQGFTYHGDWRGREMIFETLVMPTEAIIDGNRGGDTPNIDSNVEPVGVKPRQIEWGKLIEKEDAIKALTDFQSPFVQNGAAAIVRGRDRVFASALFSDRLIGKDGATVQAWDSTGRVVAKEVGSSDGATDTGMNLRKIQRAKRLLRAQEIDLDAEDLWGVLNAQEMEELYNDLVSINTDTAKMAFVDHDKKLVHAVAGVNFVSFEKKDDYDVSHYSAAIWCKSGMHYGDFSALEIRAEPNPAKKYRMHPYMENWWGSARSEDAKVIRIINKK